jgi:hypothetical protein
MDSSSRQRDKKGLAMVMSSFKGSCSSKYSEEALGGKLARGNKHIMCNVNCVHFQSIIRREKVLTR